MTSDSKHRVTRRAFVKGSTALAVAGAGALAAPAFGRSGSRSTLRVGLIGCGGRGTGAAAQALTADSDAVLWATADVFPERVETCLRGLAGHDAADRVKVAPSRQFLGLDAYRRVIESDVDVVILTSPPAFRPSQLEHAVAAGKHIFCEKPMAVDATGVRRCLEACRKAKERKLSVVSGFCWRYSYPEREIYSRILGGAIGQIQSMHATYHTGLLHIQRRQPQWSELEFQLRNWHHFNWLSGDHIVEQACHSVDKINWAMNNVPPVRCTALGGRGLREGEERGNVFDHFSVIYEYESGARCFLTCRQQANCSNDNTDTIFGTKGSAFVNGWGPTQIIRGENPWEWDRTQPRPNMYQVEHDELFASIRAGTPLNDGEWMMQSTMMSIMGRLAGYTGQTITWDQAFHSKEDLVPKDPERDGAPDPVIPRPGFTKLV